MLRVLLIDDNDLRADGCEVVCLARAATDLVRAVREAADDVIVCDSEATQAGRKVRKAFFFEKKNQKTFIHGCGSSGPGT